jgi:hypothetical protein
VKEIRLKNKRVITTPWLRIDEAAAYCSLSRSTFLAHANKLPFGGNSRTRIYHVNILDEWLASRFNENIEDAISPQRTISPASPGQDMELVNPRNGKIFRPKGGGGTKKETKEAT